MVGRGPKKSTSFGELPKRKRKTKKKIKFIFVITLNRSGPESLRTDSLAFFFNSFEACHQQRESERVEGKFPYTDTKETVCVYV